MPVINFALGQGQIDQTKKLALIERFSAVAAEETGIPVEKMIVFIEEYPADNIGVGGEQLSAIMRRR